MYGSAGATGGEPPGFTGTRAVVVGPVAVDVDVEVDVEGGGTADVVVDGGSVSASDVDAVSEVGGRAPPAPTRIGTVVAASARGSAAATTSDVDRGPAHAETMNTTTSATQLTVRLEVRLTARPTARLTVGSPPGWGG